MTEVLSAYRALPLGTKARIHRVSRLLTRQELANIAGVYQEDVDLLEDNQPLCPVVQRKLIRTLKIKGTSRRRIQATV